MKTNNYKPVDVTTWVSPEEYPCGGSLANILNEIQDNHLSNKVSSTLHSFYEYINSINILETKIKESVAVLVLHKFEETVLKYGYPQKVQTHLLNLLTAIYRNKILRNK